jgi:hypothetical protein
VTRPSDDQGWSSPRSQPGFGGWQQPSQPGGYDEQGRFLGSYAQSGGPSGSGSGQGKPPGQKRATTLLVTALALVILVGSAVAIVLLARDRDTPSANKPTGGSSGTLPPRSTSNDTIPGGHQVLYDAFHLGYQVPKNWTPQGNAKTQPTGEGNVVWHEIASRTPFDCQGAQVDRGFVAAASVKKGQHNTDQAASDFALAAGKNLYQLPDDSGVRRSTPQDGTRAGVPSALVEASISAPAGNGCKGTQAKEYVLAMEKNDSIVLFIVCGDISGGAADPAPATDAELREILNTVRFTQ